LKKVTVEQRLKQIMIERNLKQVDILKKTLPLQEKLGIKMSKSHLSNYVNGRSNPDKRITHLLAQALGVSEPWLMGYQNEEQLSVMEDADEIEVVDNYRKLTGARKTQLKHFLNELLIEQKSVIQTFVPPILYFAKKDGVVIYPSVIGAAAGSGVFMNDDLEVDEIMIPKEESYESDDVIPLYVRGDSMEPKYYDGDIIWVDTSNKSVDLHQIGVFDLEYGRVVKKMGVNKLISLNPHYPDIKLNEFIDFYTLGKVVSVLRKDEIQTWQRAQWV